MSDFTGLPSSPHFCPRSLPSSMKKNNSAPLDRNILILVGIYLKATFVEILIDVWSNTYVCVYNNNNNNNNNHNNNNNNNNNNNHHHHHHHHHHHNTF
jgi:hypothetical protein